MTYITEEDKATLVEKVKHFVDRNVETKKFQIAELYTIVERRGYNDIHLGQERRARQRSGFCISSSILGQGDCPPLGDRGIA